MRSVRLISLPDHARPGVSTWPPHYAAVRDWLKSKGVSALTDRSGVVQRSGTGSGPTQTGTVVNGSAEAYIQSVAIAIKSLPL